MNFSVKDGEYIQIYKVIILNKNDILHNKQLIKLTACCTNEMLRLQK